MILAASLVSTLLSVGAFAFSGLHVMRGDDRGVDFFARVRLNRQIGVVTLVVAIVGVAVVEIWDRPDGALFLYAALFSLVALVFGELSRFGRRRPGR